MSSLEHRIIFLAGAPLSSSLDWSEETLEAPLLSSFAPHVGQLRSLRPTSETLAPSWRSIPLQDCHLPTGLTQAGHSQWTTLGQGSQNGTPFFTVTELSFLASDESKDGDNDPSGSQHDQGNALSQYYEHSIAVHELPSSQIVPLASMSIPTASDSEAQSFDSNLDPEINEHVHAIHTRLASGPLNDLKEVPTASYLRSITPQTMTVNLVVGIISISRPRSVTIRRGQRTIELVEMIVGDNTRAGLGINIWLPLPHPPNTNKSTLRDDSLREHTLSLRPQDIVLAKNVALGTFKGNVYGQSLRRGMTTLDLLYRNTVDADDRRGVFRARDLDIHHLHDSHLSKVKKVRDWVMQFVGVKAKSKAGPSSREYLSSLPLDTQ